MEEIPKSFKSLDDLRQYLGMSREEFEAKMDKSWELLIYGFSASREIKSHLRWEYTPQRRPCSISDLINKPLSELLEGF